MKNILFAALALAVLFAPACSKNDEPILVKEPILNNDPILHNDQILVRFQNTLSEAITDASMEFDDTHVTAVGLIPANATTDYVAFDYFEIGDYGHVEVADDFPMGSLKGKKEIEDISAWSGNWCGTGVELKQLEPGFYTLEITKQDRKSVV